MGKFIQSDQDRRQDSASAALTFKGYRKENWSSDEILTDILEVRIDFTKPDNAFGILENYFQIKTNTQFGHICTLQGSIQQLVIKDGPRAAEEQCEDDEPYVRSTRACCQHSHVLS